jgi:hypothetical protein
LLLNLKMKQRDTTGLTAENRELKLRLQAMQEQAKLRDGICFFFVVIICFVYLMGLCGTLSSYFHFFLLLLVVIN